jgi:hypothetical protein
MWLPNVPMRLFLTILALALMAPFLKALIGANQALSEIGQHILKHLRHIPTDTEDETTCRTAELPTNEACVPSGQQLLKHILQDNRDRLKNLISSDERISKIYAVLWYARKANRLPLLFLTGSRLLIVAFFIVTAVHQFLTENPKVIFALLIASVFLIMQSKWLLNQYLRIESQFLDNLKGDRTSEDDEH